MSTSKLCENNFRVTIMLRPYLFCLQERVWDFLQHENYVPFPTKKKKKKVQSLFLILKLIKFVLLQDVV